MADVLSFYSFSIEKWGAGGASSNLRFKEFITEVGIEKRCFKITIFAYMPVACALRILLINTIGEQFWSISTKF